MRNAELFNQAVMMISRLVSFKRTFFPHAKHYESKGLLSSSARSTWHTVDFSFTFLHASSNCPLKKPSTEQLFALCSSYQATREIRNIMTMTVLPSRSAAPMTPAPPRTDQYSSGPAHPGTYSLEGYKKRKSTYSGPSNRINRMIVKSYNLKI